MARPSLHLPVLLDIPEPCTEDWQSMSGDERSRHCQRCDKSVHNVSELREDAIVELVGQGACVRLSIDASGTLLTAEPRGRLARIALSAALVALAACSKPGGSDRREQFDRQGFTNMPKVITPAMREDYERRQAEQAQLEAEREAERNASASLRAATSGPAASASAKPRERVLHYAGAPRPREQKPAK